jgi:hypothetical protein
MTTRHLNPSTVDIWTATGLCQLAVRGHRGQPRPLTALRFYTTLYGSIITGKKSERVDIGSKQSHMLLIWEGMRTSTGHSYRYLFSRSYKHRVSQTTTSRDVILPWSKRCDLQKISLNNTMCIDVKRNAGFFFNPYPH